MPIVIFVICFTPGEDSNRTDASCIGSGCWWRSVSVFKLLPARFEAIADPWIAVRPLYWCRPTIGAMRRILEIIGGQKTERRMEMNATMEKAVAKVPAATLVFWIVKILATTLGETGGDAVSMSMNLGYLVGTAIFAVVFLVFVSLHVSAKRFHPVLYWLTIIATTTVGTTMADFADRSLGIGYAGGTTILAVLLDRKSVV